LFVQGGRQLLWSPGPFGFRCSAKPSAQRQLYDRVPLAIGTQIEFGFSVAQGFSAPDFEQTSVSPTI